MVVLKSAFRCSTDRLVEKEGVRGRPPICKPLRNVATVDEDSLFNMIWAHGYTGVLRGQHPHLQTIEKCGSR